MAVASPSRAASVTIGPVSLVSTAVDAGGEIGGDRRVREDHRPRLANERVARGVLLPAAPVAALAALALGHDLHVPELARDAVAATDEPRRA